MRKTFNIFICLLAFIFVMVACEEKKAATKVVVPVVDSTLIEDVPDSTIYGVCGEGCSMHMLELVTANGDTLNLRVNMEESAMVKGGMMVGDRMAVVGHQEDDGSWVADDAVNLTTLLGKWSSIDKNFEIQEGGVVVSTITEPKPLTEWKICNANLVLSSDTFSVYSLGEDSLYLENEHGIFAYKRMK